MNGAPFDPDACLLEEDADDVLLGLLARDNEPLPWRARYRQQPSREAVEAECAFDKAEFLRHMRELIAKREEQAREQRARDGEEARNWRKKERKALDRIMHNEELQGLFDPPPLPAYLRTGPQPPPPGSTIQWPRPQPTPIQNIEPWFDLAKPLTLLHLRCIAQYTLGYFVAARRPMQPGASHIGKFTTRVVCPRDADMIAEAMMRVKAEIPHAAYLSAALLDVPEGVLAVTLGCPFVALRLASVEEGKRVSIEVTWDE